VGVRIRLKQMGRRHRRYYRICAMDSRQPRDGKVLEELGTYDPHVPDPEAAVTLRPSRIKHWLSVGAQPTEHCMVLFRKYMKKWEAIEAERAQASQAPGTPVTPTPTSTTPGPGM
jgi:small subunit ribosomal protein S16